jgi:hypothetical protein
MITWKKSSRSAYNGNCVEVASLAGQRILVRDSQRPSDEVLDFNPMEWEAFIAGVRNGKIDRRSRTRQQ